MQQVAELPADHGVAGQGEVDGVGPEGGGAALLVGSHDDICTAVKETPEIRKQQRQPRAQKIFKLIYISTNCCTKLFVDRIHSLLT